jgi:WD40 repeat protein
VSHESIASLEGHTSMVTSLTAYSDNGIPFLASGCFHQKILLWDVTNRKQVAELVLHTLSEPVWDLAVFTGAAGQPCLASASADETVILWDLRRRKPVHVLYGHVGDVRSLCVFRDSNDTEVLASGGSDALIILWDLTTGAHLFTLHGHQEEVRCLTFFTDANEVPMLVSASYDETFKVWDMTSCEEAATMRGVAVASSLACVAGADGRVLLACSTVAGSSRRGGIFLDMSTRHTCFGTEIKAHGGLLACNIRGSGAPVLAMHERRGEGAEETYGVRLWTSDT